ncbi:MAG: gliding motility-associated C-terminal domain-containing protein [Chitinophagia bacterium]|nr:gliding motility-associated C-terminal domain-containing protein [Chitinophagia bacterium]
MKKLRILSIVVAAVVLLPQVLLAQISGGNLFLQGRFLEIGCNSNGSLGSGGSVPSGYHATSAHAGSAVCGASLSLASIYDYQHDGWGTGTPNFMGDYTLPGTPWEGWALQVSGSANFADATPCRISGSMSGSWTSYSSSGGSAVAYWDGTAASGGALSIHKQYKVDTNGSALIVTVILKNTSSSTLTGIHYMRSCDPDNNQTWTGGSFTTVNTINYQNDYYHRVMVTATATGSTSATGTPPAPYSLGTKDCRCKSIIFTSWPLSTSADLSTVYAGTSSVVGTSYFTPGNNTNGDIAIGIVCRLGDLAPNDSTAISYAYIYNGASGIDSAFPEPAMNIMGTLYDSFAMITPCAGTTVPDTLPVTIENAASGAWLWSDWTWAPATGLSSTTGTRTTIAVSSLTAPITYTITGVDTTMGNCASKSFAITIIPPHYSAPVTSDVYYCQGDFTAPLSATGFSLLWYTTPTGGVGSSTAPTPSSSTPGVYTWYVSQAPCGASTESARTPIRVYVTPRPVVHPSNSGPICAGSPLYLFAGDTTTTGTISYTWTGPSGFGSTSRNPIISSASPADSGVYTVVLTVDGCVSAPASTLAIVRYAPPAPAVTNVTYCQYETGVPALIATGSNLLWYTSATGGSPSLTAPTPSTAVAGTFLYYVSQTTNGCEGPRAVLTVTIKPKPTAPVPVVQKYCQFETAVPLNASGTSLLWFTPGSTVGSSVAPTPVTTTPGLFTWYVSQTVNGCVSDLAIDTVRVNPKPGLPLTLDTSYCQFSRPMSLLALGNNLSWYSTATGGVRIDSFPIAPTDVAGTTTWYVSQTMLGCEGDRAPISVTILPRPDFDIVSSSPTVCQHDSLVLSYSGMSLVRPTYWWQLPGSSSFVSSTRKNDSTVVVRFDVSGSVKVILTATNYGGRCTNTDTISLRVIAEPSASFYVRDNICEGDTITLALRDRTINADHFSWEMDSALIVTANSNSGGPYEIAWPTSGLKVIRVKAFTVEDCPGKWFEDTIRVNPTPVAQIDRNFIIDICMEDSVRLTASHERTGLAYHWAPEHFFNNVNAANIWGRIQRAGYVSLTVTDAYGCHAEDSVFFSPKECCTVTFPNAFTPNNDGHNDYFRPVFKGYHRFHSFRVANRWGQTVYETINSDGGWDGTMNGVPQDMGVYFYFIRFDCSGEDGKSSEHVEKGEVTLIR